MAALPRAWDLGVSPHSDPIEDNLYLAVGRALSMWERLDTSLIMSFGYLVGTYHVAALRAIGRIESPVARLHVIREAFRSAEVTTQNSLPNFENVLKQVEKFAEVRNAIAHGTVIGVQLAENPRGYYLVPGIGTSRKVKHLDHIDGAAILQATDDAAAIGQIYDYALNSQRILEYQQEFERLLHEVEAWQLPSGRFVRPIKPKA